jgi:PiT family inorganic phosphate transporter
MELLLASSALLLAFVNGANDNLKGIATLIGSGTLRYGQALALATVSTAMGSLASILLATALVTAFSAKGLVPPEFLDAALLASVACAAALTVLLATAVGMPVSTTHALLGGIVGAGLATAGGAVALGALASGFALPLLASPFMAVVLAFTLLRSGMLLGRRSGLHEDSCVCVSPAGPAPSGRGELALSTTGSVTLLVAERDECRVHGATGLQVSQATSLAHLASGTLVGFARGLNDTPKIVGLLLGASLMEPLSAAVAVGGCMALGGLLAARKVTRTLATRLTPMTPGQGLAGNLTASFLVIGASNLGLPVSTTHVSVGGIFGVGASTGGLHTGAAGRVLASWLITLPVAALIAGLLSTLFAAF